MIWSCPVCQMNFARKDILQRHLRTRHNNSASSSLGIIPNSEVASEIQPDYPDSEEPEQEDEDEGLDEEGEEEDEADEEKQR